MQIEATAELGRANISSFQSGSVSLSDPYSFSTPSLSISVSPSPFPSPGCPGLLCPSSSFYFMPRPSLAPSSSITSRTLARRPPPTSHLPPPPPSLPSYPALPDTDATFTGLPWWHTPLWLNTSSDSIWHSSHHNIAIPLRHIRKTPTSISHILFHNCVMPLWRSS